MVDFADINQAPSPYSMLQDIGRVATPKLVSRNCLRYLQTTLIMGGGDWSQNLCFLKGHISFKFVRHNDLRCPMMGEISLET